MRPTALKSLALTLTATCLISFGCNSEPAATTKVDGTPGSTDTKPIKKGKAGKVSVGPAILKEG